MDELIFRADAALAKARALKLERAIVRAKSEAARHTLRSNLIENAKTMTKIRAIVQSLEHRRQPTSQVQINKP